MATLPLPTSASGLAAITVLSVAFGISITLSFSTMFFSTSVQEYINQKQEELLRADEKVPSPITDFSQDSYQKGYLRGQREAYWDASHQLSSRGLVAMAIGEGLLFAYLGSFAIYSLVRKKRRADAP